MPNALSLYELKLSKKTYRLKCQKHLRLRWALYYATSGLNVVVGGDHTTESSLNWQGFDPEKTMSGCLRMISTLWTQVNGSASWCWGLCHRGIRLNQRLNGSALVGSLKLVSIGNVMMKKQSKGD